MTIAKFNALYQVYKDDFDLELTMRLNAITYSKLQDKAEESDEIIYF